MKKMVFSRLLASILILGLISAYIPPNKVEARTNSGLLPENPPPVIQSLSGSNITFNPTAGGAGGYVPGVPTTIYFKSEVITDDFEWLTNTWLKFPSNWIVTNVAVASASCLSSTGVWGNFELLWENSPYELKIQHSAIMEILDTCTAIYAIDVTPASVSTDPVLVSWYFEGDTGPIDPVAKKPHYVCSDDKYTPASMNDYPCEEHKDPRASIPEITLAAQSQLVSTTEDAAAPIMLVATDTNAGTIDYTVLIDPLHGTLTGAAPNLTYTPTLNYSGSDSFTFQANNGPIKSNIATVSITVTPVNDTPTQLLLSKSNVPENQPINTVVGALSTIDPDAGDTFTYSLVSGAGDTDNASFNIIGSQLRTSEIFNLETKSIYSIRIRTTDLGGLSFEKSFSITITNANEAPTDLALSNNSLAENLAVNTVIGSLSTTDPDSGSTFIYALAPGSGATDNASFNILGNQLRTNTSFDFETKNTYSIRIRTTDGGNLFFEKFFVVAVTNINEAPTDIALSNSIVLENLPIDTVVGSLSTTDQDTGDTFSYSLVSGLGDANNASFYISGNQLLTSAVFDLETKSSYSIRIRTIDLGGLSYEESFIITITNVNEPPTDLVLSNDSLAENLPVDTVVGTLSTTDPNAIDTFSYSLVNGLGDTDNASFNISGSELRSSAIFDFETKSSYSIRVRTTDPGGLTFEKSFIITITNVNEAPMAQDQTVTTALNVAIDIALVATDADEDLLSYSVTQPAHGTVVLLGNMATYTPVANYTGPDSFTFKANDTFVDSNIATITISVNPTMSLIFLPVILR